MIIQENIPLKEFTTFDIGGNARYFVAAENSQNVEDAVAIAREKNIPFYVLAGGSNILFADTGYDGLIIHIVDASCVFDGARVTVGAGKNLRTFLDDIAEHEFTGLEKMYGVPGSVGGAIRGNAEAFGNAISDCIETITAYDTEKNCIRTFTREEGMFVYRNSFFKERPTLIILSAVFHFARAKKEDIRAVMDETLAARESRHIQDIKSAGSFFMNPVVEGSVQEAFLDDTGKESREGRVPAGWLLTGSDMDQKSVGGAQAGEMHANYFINTGGATADDVMQLASLAKTRVRNTFGVQLKEEVQLVGF